jgi:hypothetical protein
MTVLRYHWNLLHRRLGQVCAKKLVLQNWGAWGDWQAKSKVFRMFVLMFDAQGWKPFSVYVHAWKDPIFRLTNESKQPATFIPTGQRWCVFFYNCCVSRYINKKTAPFATLSFRSVRMQKPPGETHIVLFATPPVGVQYLGPNNAESHHYLPERHYRFRRRRRWQWTQIELENILRESGRDWRWKYAALGRNCLVRAM